MQKQRREEGGALGTAEEALCPITLVLVFCVANYTVLRPGTLHTKERDLLCLIFLVQGQRLHLVLAFLLTAT